MAALVGEPSGGPINILTAIPNRRAWNRQRFNFAVARQAEWVTRAFTGREPGRFTLKRLNILHSAAWLRVGRFPEIEGCPRETYRWLLFCSNFAGPWDPYRQAFLDVQRAGIRTLWGQSIGFPPYPRPGTRYALEDWIGYRLPQTQHYFRAYPGVSPNEVRGAVRLARDLGAVAATPGGDSEDEKARARDRFVRLLSRTADTLGAVP